VATTTGPARAKRSRVPASPVYPATTIPSTWSEASEVSAAASAARSVDPVASTVWTPVPASPETTPSWMSAKTVLCRSSSSTPSVSVRREARRLASPLGT
jgi:hypothetical protein